MEHGYIDFAEEIIASTTARDAKNIANRVPSYKLTNWEKEEKNIHNEKNTGGQTGGFQRISASAGGREEQRIY